MSLPAALVSPPMYANVDTPIGAAHRVRFTPVLDATRSLLFTPMEREIRENGPPLRIGRTTERRHARAPAPGPPPMQLPISAVDSPVALSAADSTNSAIEYAREQRMHSRENTRLLFNSKVVSRMHAEIWYESDGALFIRDTKSSSGTFLNHLRLSPPNVMSKAVPLRDGDVVQFGMDYQGGSENMYRAVRMRVEVDRSQPRQVTQYSTAVSDQLRRIANSDRQAPAVSTDLSVSRHSTITECCICLVNISVSHAIFSAPCSHMFHYKCIRPLLSLHYPGFQCPLCRTFADLEADFEEDLMLQAAADAAESEGSIQAIVTAAQGAGAHENT